MRSKKYFFYFLIAALACFVSGRAFSEETSMTEKNVHSFSVKTATDETKSLADYQGKALLIVNTASRCGFTGQYEGMEKLYKMYKDKGFEVLAFPANNFMGQEPGSNKDIQEFCSLKFHTTFPVFAKISVKGKDIDPLYAYLTNEAGFDGSISWNFNKFLVDANGKVVARYPSTTDPMSDKIISQLEKILPNK